MTAETSNARWEVVAERQAWYEQQIALAEGQWAAAFLDRWECGDDVPSKEHYVALWLAERAAQPPVSVPLDGLTALDGLVDRIAEAIRDGAGLAEGDPPWERLGAERRAPWRADAKRALSVIKESLTAETRTPPPAAAQQGQAVEPAPPSAPVGVEWPLSLLRAGHWREVYIGHRCMRLEVTYDYATWERLMAEVESALAQQPAAVGEEIMVNAAHDVFTLPLQPSGLSSGPRFVVHVPAPEQHPAGVDEGFVSRLAEALTDQDWDVDPDGDGSGIAQLRAAVVAAQHQEPKS